MDRCEFFKDQNPCITSWSGFFQFCTFLSVALSDSSLVAILKSLQFFFYVVYPFGLYVMFFLFPYLAPKLFCFFCIHLLFSPCAFFINLLSRIFSSFWRPCFVCITWRCPSIFSASLFSSTSFNWFLPVVLSALSVGVYFWSFYSIVSVCIFYFFVVQLVVVVSSFVLLVSSYPGFVFLFRFFMVITTLSLTSFAPE